MSEPSQSSSPRVVPQSNDDALLASLGYRQQFKREFSWVEMFSLSLSMIGIVQAAASVLIYSLPYGGPVAMVWGWFLCSFFIMAIALCIAELASAAPTSGGLYYWTYHNSSPRYRRFLCWLVGYCTTIGYISGLAGSEYATALQMFAAVTIGSEGRFIATQAQIYGLTCGLLIFHGILASSATKFLARIQLIYMALNILIFVALLIAMPIATPKELKNPASYVFGSFENLSLWPNGFAFLLSFLAPTWIFGGVDATVHISEEAKNASSAVPRAIIFSTALGCILGWAFMICLAFNMGTDLTEILASPIGQPMATIIFNSLGMRGTLAIWSLIIITVNMTSMNLLIASSRQIFAFSRDGALPFSSWISIIHPRTQTPVIAVIFCTTCAMLLDLLSFAGPAATTAIFSMGIVCIYIAYSIPISARHLGGQEFNPGHFSLGKHSLLTAIAAVAFMNMVIVILLFPTEPAPKSQTMNYTIVVVGGIIFASTAYFFLPGVGATHWFTGPIRTIDSWDVSSHEVLSEDMLEK